MAGKVGRVIRVDKTTAVEGRASFARVCVELDLTKPIAARGALDDYIQVVEYEGIHIICFQYSSNMLSMWEVWA